jgi:hypothetical protein
MAEQTFFDLPTTPDSIGVVLPSPSLRKIDFSGLDYPTARRAIIEYIQTYYPDKFNDFVESNGVIMLTEIVASVVAKLSLRNDLLVRDSTLPTAISEEAVLNHITLIGQRIKRQTPASVEVEISVEQPLFSDMVIPAGQSFSISGPDNNPIIYEVYRAPGDWTGDIIIPAGKRAVIAYGLEGIFSTTVSAVSPGGINQAFNINQVNILENPMTVTVTNGGIVEDWRVITEPIERYSATDKVVEVNFMGDQAIFRFGDDVTGQAPGSGSTIAFTFRVGGGTRGRIGVGQIDAIKQLVAESPATAPVPVRFRNISPSSGGTDKETLAQVKRRAPRDFALQRSIVTDSDYPQAAMSYSHPVYGSVSKAVASLRSGRNANLVEIYALAVGDENIPVTPSAGLKIGLKTYLESLNVATDTVEILDGAVKPIDVEMNVIVNRNADASVVQDRVESAIDDYFDVADWEMGTPFYFSNLIEVIKSIDGVHYVDLLEPANNILPTGKIADSTSNGVGFNELIIAGSRKISYYYDKTNKGR